jgi:hypothetical protein
VIWEESQRRSGFVRRCFVHAYKNGWGAEQHWTKNLLCARQCWNQSQMEWNTEDTVELGESLEKDRMCKLNELKFQMHTALFRIRLGREIRDDNRCRARPVCSNSVSIRSKNLC